METEKETQPTLPFLSSSGEGIAPRRRSSEALLTTGSFCILGNYTVSGGVYENPKRDSKYHVRGHSNDFALLGVIGDELSNDK